MMAESTTASAAALPDGDDTPGAAAPGRRSADASLVRLDNVAFTYPDGLLAVDGVDLDIAQGEVLAVVGPSGCGKSTLLSLLASLRQPSGGRLDWNREALGEAGAKDSRSSRPSRRRLSLVFQRDTVLPWRTVEQNVGLGLKYVEIDREVREARVTELLRLAKLEEFRKSYPNRLSGGMRRRVALLTGVAPMPHLLMLDEPFASLDEPTRVSVHADLLGIIYRFGLTVILVTHDLAEAITLGDRVVVLTGRPGRVATIIETNLPRPRDVRAVREMPEYQALYTQTWHELWKQTESPPSGK
jgi:NitT/TauT family transport system ATP-binding protein